MIFTEEVIALNAGVREIVELSYRLSQLILIDTWRLLSMWSYFGFFEVALCYLHATGKISLFINALQTFSVKLTVSSLAVYLLLHFLKRGTKAILGCDSVSGFLESIEIKSIIWLYFGRFIFVILRFDFQIALRDLFFIIRIASVK